MIDQRDGSDAANEDRAPDSLERDVAVEHVDQGPRPEIGEAGDLTHIIGSEPCARGRPALKAQGAPVSILHRSDRLCSRRRSGDDGSRAWHEPQSMQQLDPWPRRASSSCRSKKPSAKPAIIGSIVLADVSAAIMLGMACMKKASPVETPRFHSPVALNRDPMKYVAAAAALPMASMRNPPRTALRPENRLNIAPTTIGQRLRLRRRSAHQA